MSVRYALYPFVWINAGLWAVYRRPAPRAGRRTRRAAAFVAAGYFLVLASLTGLISVHVPAVSLSVQMAGILPPLPPAHGAALPTGLDVRLSPPGWGPRIAYVGQGFHVYFIPYRVIGYLALAYLVYAAILESLGAALPGVLGLAACVGCTVPLATASVLGVGSGIGAAAGLSVDVSTAAFLVAVLLLSWRPGSSRNRPRPG